MSYVWSCIGFAALLAHQAVSAAQPPVEAFGRIPQVTGVVLSPDGKLLAWEDNSGARPTIVVYDLQAGTQKVVFPIEGTKLRWIRWADDATLLLEVSLTHAVGYNRKYTYEWFRTLAADVTTGKSRVLLMDDRTRKFVTGATVLAARTAQPHTVTMASWNLEADFWPTVGTRLAGDREDSGWVNSVFSVDTRTGRTSVAAYGSQFTDDWVVDAAGLPVARGDWDVSRRKYTVLAWDGKGWRTIHTQENADALDLSGISADGRAVLAIGAGGHKTQKLWSIPLDGSGAKVFVEDPERDVDGVLVDTLTAAVIAVRFGGASVQRHWLDKKAETRHKTIMRAFPGRDVWIVSRSEDYQRAVVHVEGPSNPTVYYLVDFGTGRADIVGEAYPDLVEVSLGEMRSLSYESRDGAAIPAYLTLPAGAGEKNLPLVVLPHGGPEARDHLEFDWWAQFLASRGYAVLQPQFRGSTGFGEAHRKAGYRQWGGLMQDDVSDGVKTLVDQGIADPRRICIVGASYGGYAALAGAAFTPELYVCAVSVNGVSDLPAMIGYHESQSGKESDTVFYWREHIGQKLDPKVAEKSPARAAAAVTAAVLLIHSVDDTVVPIGQSEKMHKALKALHRPVKFVKLPGEDHWLSASETRVRMLSEIESFLGKHLVAPAAASSASADPATTEGS